MEVKLPQPLPLAALAEILEGALEGDGDIPISSVASPQTATEGSLVFVMHADAAAHAAASAASAVVAPPGHDFPGKAVIRVENPRYALALGLAAARPPERPPEGVHASAVVAVGASLGEGVAIGPVSYVGERVRIGGGTVVGAGCVIEKDVHIGKGCCLHANVTVRQGSRIGDRVEIHSGTVIGSDGFGYVQKSAVPGAETTFDRYLQKEEPHTKIPQIGTVVIEDDVEIGSCTTIDRGTIGATRIGRGAKIDNLVQIGHNVSIGEHALVTAQVGLAGSVRVGRHATFGGQSGAAENVEVGDGALIAARAGLSPGKKVPPRVAMAGTYARIADRYFEIHGAMGRLPRTIERLRALEEEVRALRERIEKEPGA